MDDLLGKENLKVRASIQVSEHHRSVITATRKSLVFAGWHGWERYRNTTMMGNIDASKRAIEKDARVNMDTRERSHME